VPEYAHRPIELDLPPVEDAESIQVSISLLIAALARNRIDPKRATVLLYALQLASTNAKSITIEPYATSVTREVTRTRSGRDLAAPENDSAPENSPRNASKSLLCPLK
jgi:acetyl esterase/lipase